VKVADERYDVEALMQERFGEPESRLPRTKDDETDGDLFYPDWLGGGLIPKGDGSCPLCGEVRCAEWCELARLS